ncbi:MAG: AAA family ATPase [Candidatus Thorarchaeota archaeon]|jgi:DNA sulfur modification protein DndD
MIIEEIRIVNFGPFYGEHTIQFSNDGAGVHIIRGGNGQGKTSLQRAILWALYGEVFDRNGDKIRPTSLLNHTAFKEDIYQCGVGLFLTHDKKNWSIRRKMKSRSHKDKKYEEGMTLDVVKDGEVVPDPQHAVERILPSEVSRFHFFDGEMLRDYEELLDEESPSIAILKDSIERVLGVPHLKTARNDLTAIQKKLEKERNKLMRRVGDKDLEELATDLESVTDDIDDAEKTVKKLEEQRSKLENEIRDEKRHLVDLKDVSELAKERLRIEKDIKIQETKKDGKLNETQNLAKGLYRAVLSPVAKNVVSQLKKKSDAAVEKFSKKTIAVDQAKKLEKNIASQKCSRCGTILNKDLLKQLKEELADTKVEIELLTEVPEPNLEFDNLKNALENMIQESVDWKDIKAIEEKINVIDYELARLNEELSRVQEKLVGADEDEPRRLEVAIQNMMQETGRLEESIKNQVDDKIKLESHKGELERRMASVPKGELDTLNERIRFIQSIKEVFQDAVSIYRDKRKSDVEKMATQIFKELRSKKAFEKLQINEQFGLSIITGKGTVLDRGEWRSSGEEQLVALALIGSLNKCAQMKAPVFMDTPFSRLDVAHGNRVLAYIPKIADQTVMLVTDREFRKGDEKLLKGKIKTDLTLTYKNEKEGSFIHATREKGEAA